MFERISTYSVLYTLMSVIFGAICIFSEIVSYNIEVLHPGISRSDKVQRVLYQVDSPQKEYFMNVATVVCGDDQCKIDTISIYWDTLGFYNRIELPFGVSLEKSKGDHFTNDDYEKLDGILANRSASLIDVYKEEVVGSESSDAVDGVSGATIILNTNDYVAGAVWTCYTLWHWANGNVYQIIRDIQGSAIEPDVLVELLRSESEEHRGFALEQLQRKGIYSEEVLESLLHNSPSFESHYARAIVDYLEDSNDHTFYFKGIEMSMQQLPQSHSTRLLSSLLNYNKQPDLAFVGRLINSVQSEGSYQEMDLLLRILDKHQGAADMANAYAIGLLQSEKFIVARRAYWFLDNRTLSSLQQEVLRDFHSNNRDRL